jgi:hypothetical protein
MMTRFILISPLFISHHFYEGDTALCGAHGINFGKNAQVASSPTPPNPGLGRERADRGEAGMSDTRTALERSLASAAVH